MEREEFNERLNLVLSKLSTTLGCKSNDYATNHDVYSNFRLCEFFNITSVERGMFTRMLDKVGRIANLYDKERTVSCLDESLEDTILDLAGYAILLYIWENKHHENRVPYNKQPTPTVDKLSCL